MITIKYSINGIITHLATDLIPFQRKFLLPTSIVIELKWNAEFAAHGFYEWPFC